MDRLNSSAKSAFEADGFVVLHGIAAPTILARLRQAAQRLEDRVRDLTRSAGDFVLEAAGVGGWVAWQQGDPGLRGVLRSVRNAHLYEPDLLCIAKDMQLPEKRIRPVIGDFTLTLMTVYYWAKPPRVGSEKPWHQDMAFAPPGFTDSYRNVITAWFALDAATSQNGCLEFLPASHQYGTFHHEGIDERQEGQPRAESAVEPHVDLDRLSKANTVHVPLDAGSVVIFDGMVLHRSSSNTSAAPRRAISYVYAF